MSNQNTYPSNPQIDSKKLVDPGTAYRSKVMLVFLGLILFWLIYFALIGLTGLALWWYWEIPMLQIRYGIFLKIGGLAIGVMFFIFLVKFLFKSTSLKDETLVEIKEKEQPQLFAFLRQLSKDVGTSFPKKVYVNHEINAKVFYNNPLLSMFLPVRKNLMIGLGLVNSVNLTELKAVIAHEFGHFSQGSMRLGTYVYMANRIIYDMVYSRDQWDVALERWRASDIRIAIFAWALTPFIWLTRMLLIGMYRGLNLLQSSLSRQMEFHADRVAVSVAGSNAMVHSLYKLDNASVAYNFAIQQVRSAFDHNLYTNNLFHHHSKAKEFLAATNEQYNKQQLTQVRNPQREQEVYLFKKEDQAVPDMYASHPSGYLREQNAKATFVKAVEDNRPAWILFEQAEELAQKVTKHILKQSLELPKNVTFQPAQKVQDFIDEELKEMRFDKRYGGYYGNRYLAQPEQEELTILQQELDIQNPEQLSSAVKALYNQDFLEKLETIHQQETEIESMMALLPSAQKKSVQFNGQQLNLEQLQKKIEHAQKAHDSENDWFKHRDILVYTVHLSMLEHLGHEKEEFVQRYDFQWQFQAIHYQLNNIMEHFQYWVQQIYQAGRLEESQVQFFASKMSELYQEANNTLKQSQSLSLPALSNMESVESLAHFLFPDGIQALSSIELRGPDLVSFEQQLAAAIERSVRIFRKNLGKIIQLQEEIEQQYLKTKADNL